MVMQVLLVTGGGQYSGGGEVYLDTTEVLTDMAGTWSLTAPLPSPRGGISAVSVKNNIYVFVL